MTGHSELLPVEAVVLAAGKGTRMKSDLPKVLHLLAGRPLLAHVLDVVRVLGIRRTVVVVGHQAERVEAAAAGHDLVFVRQEPQLGTGHAMQLAAPHLAGLGYTLVLSGDVPLLKSRSVESLIRCAVQEGVGAALLSCVVPDAGSYGRIVKDERGRVDRIVEARDATPEQLRIGEYNTGVYCFRTDALRRALNRLTNDNEQCEYYLTDAIGHLVSDGERVEAVQIQDADEVIGINTLQELSVAERLYRRRHDS